METSCFVITDRAEDYLRTIQKIIDKQGFARMSDIALELNIKPASAFEMLSKLQRSGLIVHQRYGEVALTKHGRCIADIIKKRHDTFRKFLELILVPQEVAVKDANILEHNLDNKTIAQITKFVDFMILDRPAVIAKWRENFKWYCDREEQNQEKMVFS